MTSKITPIPGDRVRVKYGRWAGREGTLIGEHRNPGGWIQQAQSYPIIKLDRDGRKKERVVRVVAVEVVDHKHQWKHVPTNDTPRAEYYICKAEGCNEPGYKFREVDR
jgi:hypothetical protein